MKPSTSAVRSTRAMVVAAMGVFVMAVIVFGARFEGYSQWSHPLALLGARGAPQALGFNLLGFVVPGALATVALWRLRSALPADAGWPARIGASMWLLSALAFAVQGLLPLDAHDTDSMASSLHASAWTAWWLAFAAGAGLLAWGLRRGNAQTRVVAMVSMAALVLPALALLMPLWSPPLAQRIAFLFWFAWIVWAVGMPWRDAGTAPHD